MANETTEFARRLGEIWLICRQTRKWNQMTAATAIGCNISELSLYEHGKRIPGLQRTAAMCEVYGLSMDAVVRRAEGK